MEESISFRLAGLEANNHMPKKIHSKHVRITITVLVPTDATLADVEAYVYDLEWAGGCRNPDDDPMFDSLHIEDIRVKRVQRRRGLG